MSNPQTMTEAWAAQECKLIASGTTPEIIAIARAYFCLGVSALGMIAADQISAEHDPLQLVLLLEKLAFELPPLPAKPVAPMRVDLH